MVKVTVPVNPTSIPESVSILLSQREDARKEKNYAESDRLRDEIQKLGYLVNDKPEGYELLKIGDSDVKPANSYLVLFGSGEIAPSSVDIYRQLFLSLKKRDLSIALLTTPAGFQPNVEVVYQEIKDFLLASLPDFNLTINIVFANRAEQANDPSIVSQLDSADIIFTGPGSPTYAVKQLKDTLLIKKIIERVKNGATLILASAATITFSTHALPVYEIYKVGEDLYWLDGLDVFCELWRPTTIIPHFNNYEGGSTLDTTYCYIGKDRATKLLAKLQSTDSVIGIDEHTALIIDLNTAIEQVKGKGSIYRIV
jgi:peptidase E